jgi:RNA polymerase sigma-70 factor (ECF subfamily)
VSTTAISLPLPSLGGPGVQPFRYRSRWQRNRVRPRAFAAPPPSRPTGGDFRAEIVALVPVLERYARRALAGSPDTADLVQETCRRALEARSRFIAGSNLRAWTICILRHLICDRARLAARETLLGECVDEIPETDYDERPRWAEISDESLAVALAALSPLYRTTYLMYAAEGLSYKAIALRLKIAPNTVGTRLLRARALLRADLDRGECSFERRS